MHPPRDREGSFSPRIGKKHSKTKSIFPTQDSVLKMYYLVVRQRENHTWTNNVDHWELVYDRLMILYGDRIKPYVSSFETLHT